MKEVDNIQKGLAHKPFNTESEEYKKFTQTLQSKIHKLKQDFNISF
jgi:ABC-type Zn uptake system ZnuABC Zn-binding protein ZnuA